MQLSISIVVYKHNINDIQPTLNSVLGFMNADLTIIDNSPDNSLEKDLSIYPITYIHNPVNPGFGASHNIALLKSIDSNVKYHLVLNPDVYFESTIIGILIKFMDENKDIGNVMPKVYYPNGEIQYLCKLLPTPYDWIARRFNPIKNMVKRRDRLFELQFTGYNNIMDVPYLSGCFMFLRVDAIKKVGFYDEKIFMYGEETDMCRRLNKNGFRTVFYPFVSITHQFQKGSHKSFRLTWIGVNSAIYYFNKWGWFLDTERRRINRETLVKLNYKK
jgi:GT2 family glycosyltransferase